MKSHKKILAITLSVIMALGVVSVSAFAEDVTTDEVITYVDVTVAAPVAGESATGDYAIEGLEYGLEFIQWREYTSDGIGEPVDGEFEANSAYVVCLTVMAAEGYVFDSVDNLVISVNGYEAELADLSDDSKYLSFTCVFECDAEDVDDGDDVVGGGFDFGQLLNLIKTVLLTFVRFLGSLIGLS
ncbi:MAG: hypothetical protein IJ447_04690 [Clostridia bacterium]|nr:hypothetical protein [Clostridia bacterium]